jgi:hypothetical protein
MPEHRDIPGFEGQVQCAHCMKKIPRSEAHQPEGEEHVSYFCGIECYEAWRKQATKGDPRPGRE